MVVLLKYACLAVPAELEIGELELTTAVIIFVVNVERVDDHESLVK